MPMLNVGTSAGGLRTLSLVMGAFLVLMGCNKVDWLMDSGLLTGELEQWRESAPGISRWYLNTVAIPGAPVFARLVLLGELGTGAALVGGFRVRLMATVALLMVLNFHFASGVIFSYGYLTNGYGPPVVGGLLALVIGGARLPLTIR